MISINEIAKSMTLDIDERNYELKRMLYNLEVLNNMKTAFDITENGPDLLDNISLVLGYIISKKPRIEGKEVVDSSAEIEVIFNNLNLEESLEFGKSLSNNEIPFILNNDKYSKIYNHLKTYMTDEEMLEPLAIVSARLHIIVGNNKNSILVDKRRYNASLMMLNNFFNDIDEAKRIRYKEYDSIMRRSIQVSDAYKEILEKIKNNSTSPVLDIPILYKKYFSNRTLSMIYELILDNQTIENSNLDSEKMKYTEKSEIDQLESVFRKYNLSLKLFSNKDFIIKHCDAQSAMAILNDLKNMGIQLDEVVNSGLEYILCCSNKEITNTIFRYFNLKMITKEFILSNIGIFVNQDIYEKFLQLGIQIPKNEFENMEQNVELLKKQKIDFEDSKYVPRVLLRSFELNKNIFKLCDIYQTNSLSVFNNPLIFDLIDLLIELDIDYKEIDFNNIGNEPVDLIKKRIKICNQINMDILMNFKITKPIITGDGFILDNSKLNDFIVDDTNPYIPTETLDKLKSKNKFAFNENFELISFLDDRYLSGDVYNIGDVTLSRNRIIRNLSILDGEEDTFSALIYKSFLSDKDIKTLSENINQRSFK